MDENGGGKKERRGDAQEVVTDFFTLQQWKEGRTEVGRKNKEKGVGRRSPLIGAFVVLYKTVFRYGSDPHPGSSCVRFF